MKTVCLNVIDISAKTKILLDGAIIAKTKLIFLSGKVIPGYFIGRI